MEAEIEQFLSGSGRGYGYGSGSGNTSRYGSGDGSGSSDGSGDGNSCGSGYGYGDGSGRGYDDGSGYGYGDGYYDSSGRGYGDGYGDGSGYGYGNGSGYGYGNGDGYGYDDGDGSGKGYHNTIEILGDDIYSVDGIFCRFEKVHSNWAKITVISVADFSENTAFLAKYENCIAHGSTIKEAMLDVMEKYFSDLDFEQVKENLLAEFRLEKRLTVAELYRWHGLLTGSCRFGRTQFQKEHGLKDDDTLSLEEFVKLCGTAYGGDKVRELIGGRK